MVMAKETLLVWNLSDFDSNPSSIAIGTFILLELKFDHFEKNSKTFGRKALNLHLKYNIMSILR